MVLPLLGLVLGQWLLYSMTMLLLCWLGGMRWLSAEARLLCSYWLLVGALCRSSWMATQKDACCLLLGLVLGQWLMYSMTMLLLCWLGGMRWLSAEARLLCSYWLLVGALCRSSWMATQKDACCLLLSL